MASTETQEIIRSLSELKSETRSILATLQAKVDGINRRLDQFNGHIARHDEAIQELRLAQGQIDAEVGRLQDEQDQRLEARQQWRLALVERALWLAGSILLALVVHFARL